MNRTTLIKLQAILVTAVIVLVIALFALYLGFMTNFYILFYDGTMDMFAYYEELQVFNKEAFSIATLFIVVAFVLNLFGLRKLRPGLAGLFVVLGATAFIITRSLALMKVIPTYRDNYLALDFSELEEYSPASTVFDLGMFLHTGLIIITILLSIVALIAFIQRIREGNPLIRRAT